MSINEFLKTDQDKLETLVANYPQNIPVPVAADFLGCTQESLRQTLCDGKDIGMAWRQTGKCNRAFFIPTAKFVRWYMNTTFI
ncbi:MAG: hypothetical protein IJ031_00605 [Oscillospiraceae bacterium]|nr:hypothetical protein [Oscillospiraceae bacterium]MBQ8379074.1 hypothetical protein [Oscillospiraceae bacterium]MBQ8883086.1 hypothetical protein [Oscillospiraceae bacterium]